MQDILIDADLALRMVREAHILAFDTETTGLTKKDRVCGYVFTDESRSVYIPVGHEGGGNIPFRNEFERSLGRAFDYRYQMGFPTVGHHLGFDLRACNRQGIYPKYPLEDTMINESLIDDLTLGYGLDNCSARHKVTVKTGAELYAEMARRFGGLAERKQMANFYKMPGDHPLVVDYAATDGIATLALRHSQQKLLDDEELRKPWKLECQLIEYVARIHERGMRIDMDYAAEVMVLISKQVKELLAKFQPGFNVRSPKDVEALFRANGYKDEDFARTDNGACSFTESWLETNEIGEAILDVRRVEKARDSFVTPLITTENENGRVHPILNQSKSDDYGVQGARFSCSEPNMQAFPKRNETIGRLVRRLVVADEGMELTEADYKQQEPRLFAHFSGDERLTNGYITGTLDIHDIASADFGLPRNTAKRLGLGMLTGMQPKALAGHMRWDIDRATAAHHKFLRDSFPKIGIFQERAKNVYKSRGYVRSILGRRARLDHPRFAYRSVSRIIQNSGGDHMKTGLLRACQYEDAHPEVQMLMTIHDSIIWQRQDGFDDSELIKILEDVAHKDLGMTIPIPVDVGRGRDWATASYGEH